MKLLAKAGLERIGIAIDACTPDLFEIIKGSKVQGPYQWNNHWESLKHALSVFGKGYVTTHYIVGLGETEEEMITQIYRTIQNAILPGLFMFTPVKGTILENRSRPPIVYFRKIQLIRYLLLKDLTNFHRFIFEKGKLMRIKGFSDQELKSIIENGAAFKTSGCPDCNRPYYTSNPGEEPDGFARDLLELEKKKIYEELSELIN
jgi:biotin synthase